MRGIDLSIGQRLALGFGAVLTVLALALGVTGYEGWRLSHEQARLANEVNPKQIEAHAALTAYLRQSIAIRSYALSGDERHLDQYQTALDQSHAALARLEGLPKAPEGQVIFAEAVSRARDYDAAATQFLALLRRSPGPEASQLHAAELALGERREALVDRLSAFAERQVVNETAALTEIRQAQETAARTLAGMAVAALALGSIGAVLTARAIAGRARRLGQAARALAAGDYTPALMLEDGPASGREDSGVPPRDELRWLGRAFAQMAATIQQREERLDARNAVATALASTIEVSQLTEQTLRHIAAYTGCEFGLVYVLDAAQGVLQPAGKYALNGTVTPVAVGDGIPGQAAAAGHAIVVRDLPADAPFRVRFGFDDLPPRTIVATPVRFREQTTGVLLLGSVRDLAADALSFIEETAVQLGVSLQNALSHRQVLALSEELQDKNTLLEAQNEELQAQAEEIQAQNEELQAQNEEIQSQSEELQAQNEELDQQRSQLLEVDRQKDEFLLVAAHELKTPITSLRGYTQLLLRRARRQEGLTEVMDPLTQIDRQANDLTQRVDRLLDVSRLYMGRLHVEIAPVDLAALVTQQVAEAQARTERHRIILTDVSDPLIVPCDRGYVQQVIANLLENAIRYSPNGGEISVRLEADEETARITVQDSGIGIPTEVLPNLFQPYFRHDAARQVTAAGLGIGLYIAQQIVTLHGGRIQAESEAGQGATFTVTLPLLSAAALEVPPPATEGEGAASVRLPSP